MAGRHRGHQGCKRAGKRCHADYHPAPRATDPHERRVARARSGRPAPVIEVLVTHRRSAENQC